MAGPRQAIVSKTRIGSRELGVTVGRQVDAGEALIVQRVREWQRDGGDCIVPVITDVHRAWHNTTPYLIYHVLADARCWRWGGRWRRGWRWTSCRRWRGCASLSAWEHPHIINVFFVLSPVRVKVESGRIRHVASGAV